MKILYVKYDYAGFLWSRHIDHPAFIFLFSTDGAPLGYLEQDRRPGHGYGLLSNTCRAGEEEA